MEIAYLGYEVGTASVRGGTKDLRDHETQAGKTEQGQKRLGRQSKATSRDMRALGSAVATLDGPLGGVASRFRSFGSLLRQVGPWAAGALLAIGALTLGVRELNDAVGRARQFDAALGEVSTLLPGVADDLGAIEEEARRMGVQFGTGSTAQAKAYYQAISAGAAAGAESTALLAQANKVAIGGVTDTTTAVDILTTATNAYAAENLSAADAADTLFVGMKAGKTTIGELAHSLGRAIPFATAAGVSFSELTAATAALTTQGQDTDLAITGLRGILSQLLKPSDDAIKLARQLGIDFSITGLQAKGLSGFMADLVEKTDGSQEAMTRLFNSQEALTAVFALAGQGGVKFNEILGDMETRAGAADEAYDKMAGRLSQRWNVIMAKAADAGEHLGTILLATIVPAAETMIDIFSGLGEAVGSSDIALKAIAVTVGTIVVVQLYKLTAALVANTVAAITGTTAWRAYMLSVQLVGPAAATTTAALSVLGAAVRFALGPIGLMITAIGLLTAGWVIMDRNVNSFSENLGTVTSKLADFDRRMTGIQTTQDKVAADTAALTDLQNDLSDAIANQATVAANTARTEISAINDRIAKNKELLAQYRQIAQADLTDAQRALREAQEQFDQTAARALAQQEMANAPDRPSNMLLGLSGGALTNRLLQQQVELEQQFESSADSLAQYRTEMLSGIDAANAANQPLSEAQRAFQEMNTPLAEAIILLDEAKTKWDALNGTASGAIQTPTPPRTGSGGGLADQSAVNRDAIVQREIDNLGREAMALREVGDAREVLNAQLGIEEKIRSALREKGDLTEAQINVLATLTDTEKGLIEQHVLENLQLKRQADAYDDIMGPLQEYRHTLEAVQALLANRRIGQNQADILLSGTALERGIIDLKSQLGGISPGLAEDAARQQLQNEYQQRLQLVMDWSRAHVDQERRTAEMLTAIWQDYQIKTADIDRAIMAQRLGMASEGFGRLADAFKGFAGEQSAAYKTLFAISKAFAIAQSIINIQRAMSEALALPFPANLAQLAAVAAEGASIISAITSVATGFRDGGFTGYGSQNQVAGVVHGQEGVLTASAMRGIGIDALNYMNRNRELPPAPANDRGRRDERQEVTVHLDIDVSVDDEGKVITLVRGAHADAVNTAVKISGAQTDAKLGDLQNRAARPGISAA